ncbi:MAG: DUF2905 domain-containing protein [Saprospiraceae bacterium]|nr:DUF2905 domain-containing protein [Saprospiraceae bacterium]
MQETGKWVILAGVFITLAGIIWYFLGDKLSFIGHLPGDIRIEKENFRFYFPLTTMILISLIINIILKLIRHFGN